MNYSKLSDFKIDILSEYRSKFKEHLDFEDNSRILFSGTFGIGKTTFLKEFFQEDNIVDAYESLHLFPVNYSVASNEDIFELIKFDIFFQLLGKVDDYEKVEFNLNLTAQNFIVENYKDILLPFLKFVPEVGGNLYEISKHLIELKKKFKTFKENVESDEIKEIKEFISEFSNRKGTIYENDFYTELIIGLVEKLKGDNSKKTVLIIDDLDRIDPEHIFRLLNIFSTHSDVFGDGSNENKFGFDKVILVCDIENIKSIYKHKYGINTDFNGYIDKFYSKQVFNFNISEIIDRVLDKILMEMSVDSSARFLVSQINTDELLNFRYHLSKILYALFLTNSINLRSLKKTINREFKAEQYQINSIWYNYQLYLTQMYDILLFVYEGNHASLISDLKKCVFTDEFEFWVDYNVMDVLSILDMRNHHFQTDKEHIYSLEDGTEIIYKLNVQRYVLGRTSHKFVEVIGWYKKSETIGKRNKLGHFDSLIKSFEIINKIKMQKYRG